MSLKIDILTVLPELLESPFNHSILKRAKEKKPLNAEEAEDARRGHGEIGVRRGPDVRAFLCAPVTLWQIFLPLRSCEEFPIIAGAR